MVAALRPGPLWEAGAHEAPGRVANQACGRQLSQLARHLEVLAVVEGAQAKRMPRLYRTHGRNAALAHERQREEAARRGAARGCRRSSADH